MYGQRERSTRLLLGTRYLMLRRDFIASTERQRSVPSVARRFLVSMGGSDPDNITAKVVEMLQRMPVPGWEAIAVLRRDSPHLEALRESIRNSNLPIQLMHDADMAKLMGWADIAITTGGTTLWELAFMGVPAVAVTRAEHERLLLESAAAHDLAINMGPFQAVSPQQLGEVVASLAFDEARRLKMSNAGRALVDGQGASRIVSILGEARAT
jgi:UDP-2,4-diacetamido-2,4,6-trideoxy-beta-L-altropyranose hydrolase